MDEQTTDVTEALPTMEPKTRTRVKTGAALLIGVAVLGLSIDSGIKRFKERKTVTVTVEDKPES